MHRGNSGFSILWDPGIEPQNLPIYLLSHSHPPGEHFIDHGKSQTSRSSNVL